MDVLRSRACCSGRAWRLSGTRKNPAHYPSFPTKLHRSACPPFEASTESTEKGHQVPRTSGAGADINVGRQYSSAMQLLRVQSQRRGLQRQSQASISDPSQASTTQSAQQCLTARLPEPSASRTGGFHYLRRLTRSCFRSRVSEMDTSEVATMSTDSSWSAKWANTLFRNLHPDQTSQQHDRTEQNKTLASKTAADQVHVPSQVEARGADSDGGWGLTDGALDDTAFSPAFRAANSPRKRHASEISKRVETWERTTTDVPLAASCDKTGPAVPEFDDVALVLLAVLSIRKEVFHGLDPHCPMFSREETGSLIHLLVSGLIAPSNSINLKCPASSAHQLFTRQRSLSTDSIATLLSSDISTMQKFGVASLR